MTRDRTPKQRIIEKLLKEIGFFTSDDDIALLSTKILGTKITSSMVRHVRDSINMSKEMGNIKTIVKGHIGLEDIRVDRGEKKDTI